LSDRRGTLRHYRCQRCPGLAWPSDLRGRGCGCVVSLLALAEIRLSDETVIARRPELRYAQFHDRMDRHYRPLPTLTLRHRPITPALLTSSNLLGNPL